MAGVNVGTGVRVWVGLGVGVFFATIVLVLVLLGATRVADASGVGVLEGVEIFISGGLDGVIVEGKFSGGLTLTVWPGVQDISKNTEIIEINAIRI